ncbi:MAG: pyridoxamine 5'-phosphate oxidase family protein [Kiritimatiellia bacterium]|jgi:hypothetical protein
MSALPQNVRAAWDNRDGPVILATVNRDGRPNIIYATCVGIFGDDQLVVADNFFNKTRQNILQGCKGAILFRDKSGKAYQVKGAMEYHKEGEIFRHMKSWNPPQHPGHAAAVLKAEEAYSGAEKLGQTKEC